MWDVKGSLIQVEIAPDLAQRYSSKGFFGGSNNDGKFLLDAFAGMRGRLQAEDIVVPTIACRDDSSLGNGEFIVYVGSEYCKSSICEAEIVDVIEYCVRNLQMESISKDTIHECIRAANESISQRRYRDGLRYFDKAYFWSNLLEGCEEEVVDTILQIGRILVQNNDIYHARLCAGRAKFVTAQSYFYNPYLKCASDEFSGLLDVIEKDFSAADEAYTSAFNRIANVPEANLLKIGVLAANLQVLPLCGNYVKANQAAQLLIDVLSESGCTNLMPMYKLKNYIADCAIERLGAENAQLRQDVQLLAGKYTEAMEKLRFREQFKSAILVLLKWGILNLPALSGSLTLDSDRGHCTKFNIYNNINNINQGEGNQISFEVRNNYGAG